VSVSIIVWIFGLTMQQSKIITGTTLGIGLLIGHLTGSQQAKTHNELNPEVVLPAIVTDIHDGDTVTCQFNIKANIRMLDNWSKEMSESGGKESKDNLIKNCPVGSEVLVKIPLKDNISKSFTFGRLLGRVYKDGIDLSELQVSQGFATKKKSKE
jgi:endonuclease YncB( thermonuclease family)